MSDILVYNNWDPLEEIWLGDTYPENFYDDLKPEIRDSFCKMTEMTKEDLKVIEKKFTDFGVIVKRPTFKSKDHYIEPNINKLIKPPICPRDENAVIGDTLFYTDYYGGVWEEVAKTYNPAHIRLQGDVSVSGANIVKLGRDIVFDFDAKTYNKETNSVIRDLHYSLNDDDNMFSFYNKFLKLVDLFGNDYRLHYSANGGHCDAMFMPVRPGLLLATNYWKDYEVIFPEWTKIFIYEPTYMKKLKDVKKRPYNTFNTRVPYRWSIEQFQYKNTFNKFIEKYCMDWIGNYTETYFEVNVVMVDEKNMICIDTSGVHDPLFELLQKEGINVHIVPWRTRSFWDGGIHCITLDVRRKAVKKDYFNTRGDNGVCTILSSKFNNSKELFLQNYNDWVKKQKH